MIELIFVIFILAIVAGIGAPNLMRSYDARALEADEMAIFMLNDSTESYALVGGFSLDSADSEFVFSDCSVGGVLDSDLMINELMENGFLIARPDVESKNASFVWNGSTRMWELSVGS